MLLEGGLTRKHLYWEAAQGNELYPKTPGAAAKPVRKDSAASPSTHTLFVLGIDFM